MKALVTGATGFIGYSLVKELIQQDFHVRILARNPLPPHLKELPIEVVQGDLLSKSSLSKALQGRDCLFHLAAHYSLWEKDPDIFYKVNVKGTENILSLAAEQGIQKVVYTSSVATLKPSLDETPVNEDSEARLEDMVGHYKKSKYLAEKSVQKLVEQGIPAVIVNPSAPIGPYDVKPTPTGKILVDFLKGKMFGFLHTGLNLVAVQDVALGHILALEKGKVGKRYILGNQNLYLIEIFQLLEKISGVPAPKMRIPYSLAYATGCISEIWARVSNSSPGIPLDGVRMAKRCMFFDSSRAKKELGYSPVPIESAMEQAVDWFRTHGYV